MVNTNKLKAIIVERGYTGAMVAKELGISSRTFYQKMKRKVFNSDEIEKLVKLLKIENPLEVFFVDAYGT